MAKAWRHLTTLASLATPVALPVERLEGRLYGSDVPVAMTFAGTPATADFVAGALFAVERRTPVGRLKTPFQLRSGAFSNLFNGSDLVVAELPPFWGLCLPANTQLRMPAWVSQEIRADSGSGIVLPAQLRKEVMRHSRRESYLFESSDAFADIKRFYTDLYLPYVTARFQSGAVVVDEDRFLDVSRDMTLAILRVDRQWVAGTLFRQRGNTLHLGWFGSTSAPPMRGASEVLDSGIIERAAVQGARRVVMGHSRPSLSDGVLRYKRRFGATIRPTRFPQRIIGLQVLKPSPALVAALNSARFLSFHRGQAEAYEAPAIAQGS